MLCQGRPKQTDCDTIPPTLLDQYSIWENEESFNNTGAKKETLPKTVLGWLPLWWSRVLFPGKPVPAERWNWQQFFLLLILPGVLLYPCLSFYLFEPDEGRYAQIAREMLTRGEWIVPTLQGEPYLDKPPLFYWLVMASYALFGFHDWAARVVPALAVHGSILATYFFGRRLLDGKSAFWGALVLTLAPGFAGMGRLLVLDGLLTLWVTLALGCAFLALHPPVPANREQKSWWLAASLACGLGILTKGPVILLLVFPPLWLYRRLSGRGIWPDSKAWLQFGLVILAVNLPWFGTACVKLPDFFHHFFWEHNVLRFVQPFDHIRPVWFYVPILLAGFLPGTLLLVPWMRFLLSSRDGKQRPGELGFLVLAGGWCVLFFSLSGCKLPTYILPAFPPLSLALGCCLARTRRLPWVYSAFVFGLCFVLMQGMHYVLVPWWAHYRSPMNQPERMQELCGDPATPVYCFPRNIDSVAFYVGRADFVSYRSKQANLLLEQLQNHPRSVVLFSHRHSLEFLRTNLPANLKIIQQAPLGLCDLAVIEQRQ